MEQQVVLVDKRDRELGSMEKLEVHKRGLLHRAVSVFIINEEGKLLMQKRAMKKYHSPGLWSNASCNHPMPGEPVLTAARRRLKEEMGIDVKLDYAFNFIYRVEFSNGLIEYELDHVFVGYGNKRPKPDRAEVMDWKWMSETDLNIYLKACPELFTEWFKLCYARICQYKNNKTT